MTSRAPSAAARDRGVRIRIMFNQDEREEEPRPFEPPPPRTEPDLLEQLGVPLKPIPGWRDLMHHKYAVRDGAAVWTGSCNWTLDNWTRAENVLATVDSRGLAASYARDFEQMWARGSVDERDGFDARPVAVGDASVRPWFCPGRGPELSHRIAKRDRRRAAAGADRVAGADRRADPGHAERGAGGGPARRRRRLRRDPGRPGLRPVGAQPALAVEGAAAAPRARGLPRQALDSRTRRSRSTTSCTRRSRSPTTRPSSAPSTSRARARRTPRTCSRSPTRRWPSAWRPGSTGCGRATRRV